jgi:hypothetical protein
VSKFVGKFRREKDYSDDFKSSRNIYNERKRKSENAEQKKVKLRRYQEEEYDDDEYRYYGK